MKTFKETTHSLVEELLENKESKIMGLLGATSAIDLITGSKGLKGLYDKLPEGIKNKISSGESLSSSEKLVEANIAKHELSIPMRPTMNSLDALNTYYRESNPVSQIPK